MPAKKRMLSVALLSWWSLPRCTRGMTLEGVRDYDSASAALSKIERLKAPNVKELDREAGGGPTTVCAAAANHEVRGVEARRIPRFSRECASVIIESSTG